MPDILFYGVFEDYAGQRKGLKTMPCGINLTFALQ